MIPIAIPDRLVGHSAMSAGQTNLPLLYPSRSSGKIIPTCSRVRPEACDFSYTRCACSFACAAGEFAASSGADATAFFLAASLIAEIREGKSGDISPDDFRVFPGDFQVSRGRMSHKIPSIWPAPQLLNPRGPDRSLVSQFGRFPRKFRRFLTPSLGWGLPARPAIGLPWQRDLPKKPMTIWAVALSREPNMTII
jgi:hypothetical protein